jgi:hypothetical protein
MGPSVRSGRAARLAPGTALLLRLAMPLAAALVAVLAAHVAIDVVGDYVLAHDTYDDHAHGSRRLASLALAVTLLTALWAFARAVLAETRGSRGALRAALYATLPESPVTFVLMVVAAVVPLLPAMGWVDALTAGARVDDVADLVGGSIPLGAGIAGAFALAAGTAAYRVVAFLGRHHRAIVRAVEAFVRLAGCAARAALTLTDRPNRPRALAAPARRAGRNRAPPIPSRQTLTA